MPYTYSPTLARYRDNKGKFVKAETVVALARTSIAATGDIAGGLAGQYKSSELAAKEFKTVMRQEIKDEYIRQYVLSRGGLEQMTAKDWGSIGSMVKSQYAYLNDFTKALPDMSEDAIAARAKMYINSANQAANKGAAAAIEASGEFGEERWVLDESKENCSGCADLAAKGWVKIGELGTVPCAGATPCLSNCACRIEYR